MNFRLSPGAAVVVVQSIDPAWGAKREIVLRVSQHPEGLRCSASRWSTELQRGRRWLWACLRQLEADRVLEVEAGGGHRASLYRLRPDFTRWRNVPWLIDPADVVRRVLEHVVHEASDELDPGSEVSSVAVYYRDARSVASRWASRSTATLDSTRHRDATALASRSDNRSVGATNGLASRSTATLTATPTATLSPSSSSPDGGALGADDAIPTTADQEEDRVVNAVGGMVLRHAAHGDGGRRFLAPSQQDRIRQLVRVHGTQWVDDLPDIMRTAPNVPVPGLIGWLGSVVGMLDRFGLGPDLPDLDADGDALDDLAHYDDLLNPRPGLYVASDPLELDDEAKEAGREWINAARGALDRSQSVADTGQNGERLPAAGGVGQ